MLILFVGGFIAVFMLGFVQIVISPLVENALRTSFKRHNYDQAEFWCRVKRFQYGTLHAGNQTNGFCSATEHLAKALMLKGNFQESENLYRDAVSMRVNSFCSLPHESEYTTLNIDKYLPKQIKYLASDLTRLKSLKTVVSDEELRTIKEKVVKQISNNVETKTNSFGYYDGHNGTYYRTNPYSAERIANSLALLDSELAEKEAKLK